MRVLGIDPGTRFLGFGVVEETRGQLRHVGHGVIKADPNAPLEARLSTLFGELTQAVALFRPDAVAVEGLFTFKNARTALILGHARGVALLVAAQTGLAVHEYAPARVKKAVGAQGASSKEAVARMVTTFLRIPPVERADASDALAVAICHLNSQRSPTGSAPRSRGRGGFEALGDRLKPSVSRFGAVPRVIAALKGQVLEKNLSDAVLDVNGVGYRVHFSLITLARLPEEGQVAKVRIRTVVREDALDLFGFLTRAEEDMFLLLTSVSHVGPKLALSVLSGLEVNELAAAIARGEVARLTKIHGVGKKTAERLVLELKDKVKGVALELKAGQKAPAADGARTDLVSALVNLGYKPAQAEKAADLAAERAGEGAAFELLFREALKGLRSGAPT